MAEKNLIILAENNTFEKAEYFFNNGTKVVLYLEEGSWEYLRDLNDSSIWGAYKIENNAIIYWDGCSVLPEEVTLAFKHFGFDNIKHLNYG